MLSLLDHLTRLAQDYPSTPALIDAEQTLTYAELLERVQAEAHHILHDEQLRPGTICQFHATQDVHYVIRFLALHLAGVICVPVDAPIELPPFEDTSVSDILFTTGSTSRPKGVLLSWEAIWSDADNLIRAHQYRHGTTFVVCGPIHHFGCWSKVLPTLLSGGTLQILPGLKDTQALLEALGNSDRTATFLVPSAIRMLLQLCRPQLAALADHIDFIETGAAPIATSDMELLREVLPHTRLYNTYASTETGVVCTYPFHQPEVIQPACVGPTMHHAHVEIDSEGRIVVSGPMIMSGYLLLDEGTSHTLPLSPIDGGHHVDDSLIERPTQIVTTDIGRLDDRGFLYISGRVSDFINVGGLKVAPAEVEEAAQSFPGLADCICLPAPHALMGQVPRLLVVMAPGSSFDKRALIQHLKAHLELHKVPLQYEEVSEIRKTFNGKKDRKSYLQ